MFICAGDTKGNLIYKKLEMWLAFSLALVPVLFLLKDAYILSENLLAKHNIAGVVDSPYFPGHKADLNDGQLNSFIEGLPTLILIGLVSVFLRRFLLKINNTLSVSLYYYVFFGLSYGLYLHGSGILFILLIILANHLLCSAFSGSFIFPAAAWMINLSFLIITEYYNGYKFAWISDSLAFLDQNEGVFKWHRVNNLCMLKIISYLMDHHWKITQKVTPTLEKHMIKCEECKEKVVCLKFRMEKHADSFGFVNFIAYVFYPPLYVAGPTLTYNGWISQVEKPQQTFNEKRLLIYLLRFILVYLILMWFIHNLYFPTIANHEQNRYILDSFSPYELIIASYFILKWIWLKFTVIWRYFRIWALFDGIESPENMGRCMSNNYGFEGFWRMWHRAFNQWLIRYLFIPLGGTKYKVINIWIVFGFVAIWHDLTLNLLAWGWGMCIFIMPEVIVKSYFASPSMHKFRKMLIFSWMSAIAGGVYICLMIMANLVGFSFGVDGLKIALHGLINWEGAVLMVKVLAVLTFAAHFMFLFREDELRKGGKEKGY